MHRRDPGDEKGQHKGSADEILAEEDASMRSGMSAAERVREFDAD